MLEKSPKRQSIETDVVVVGYGGAGATSAIVAHDNGAKVIILEKMPFGGGNVPVTGGHYCNPTGMGAAKYLESICGGYTDRETINAFVESAMKNNDWIREIGGEGKAFHRLDVLYPSSGTWPSVPGVEFTGQSLSVVTKSEKETLGESLWRLLSTNVQRRDIKVMTSTRATELVTNERGEVVSVIAEKDKEEILIKARRAVILTCGGFENNEAMTASFLGLKPLYTFGTPGKTGDGVVMAQKVGAQLWHMTNAIGGLSFKAPEYEAAFLTRFHGPRFIYVDKCGKRFLDETGWHEQSMWGMASFFDPRRFDYPRLPSYGIFDDVTRRRGPLYMSITGANREYKWSLDNSKEIARGWIKRGKTVRELARQISLDESTLENTVSRYNEYCKAGTDPDFDRSKETLEPIDQAPYYALEVWPCLYTTRGGPRRDGQARVLDNSGKPIPRLYSAGVLGSIWGIISMGGGGTLGECIAFGRIAGRNAATHMPWGQPSEGTGS